MKFTHNAKTHLWNATTTFQGRTIAVQITSDHAAEDRESIVTAAINKTLANWDQIQRNLADSLLETYNDGWSDPDDGLPELSRERFLKKVKLRTVYVMEEGAISLYFDDSDLFAGHTVEIFWTPDKMYDATLEG